MENFVEINLKLRKDTYEDILNIVGYENMDNLINQEENLPTDYKVEDFITGCINFYIKEIHDFANLSGYGDLSKPYQIKNKFKDKLDELDMKQKDLVEKTGINKGSISSILSNQKQPSLDYFIRIWIALNCPPIHEVLYREEN